MAHITYFTKPGCLTSGKQVDLLRQSGHEVEVRDLLSHPWEPEELMSYFGEMPVKLWFNPNAPRVKSGEIDPSAYDSADSTEPDAGRSLADSTAVDGIRRYSCVRF